MEDYDNTGQDFDFLSVIINTYFVILQAIKVITLSYPALQKGTLMVNLTGGWHS